MGAEGSPAPPEGLTPCSPVCTAGLDRPLTAEPLEARGTEAEEGARLVHTGTPVEARGWREKSVRGGFRACNLARDLGHTQHRGGLPLTSTAYCCPVSYLKPVGPGD